MKNQALFSSKDKNKKLKCCLLQFLFGALRVNSAMQTQKRQGGLICAILHVYLLLLIKAICFKVNGYTCKFFYKGEQL